MTRKTTNSSSSVIHHRSRPRRLGIDVMLIVAIAAVMVTTFWFGAHLHGHDDAGIISASPLSSTTTSSLPYTKYRRRVLLNSTTTIKATQTQASGKIGLWHDNPNIPPWLQEYMTWHHDVIHHKLTNDTKHDYDYVVLRCYSMDERCGGVSDRLKPVPLIVLAAAQSKRLLFIHWYQRPCPLEEFLLPPPNGLNWTVPDFLVDDFLGTTFAIKRAGQILQAAKNPGWIKPVHIHDAQGGSAQYDEVNGPNSFLNVYHDVFRILFRPSTELEAVIQEKMQRGGKDDTIHLVPGRYSTAHYRAEYGREIARHPKLTEPSFIQGNALNALRCAIQLQPGDPIYFASDNIVALEAVRKIAAYTKYPIITFDRDEDVVLRLDDIGIELANVTDHTHLDIPYQPKDYYSTFIDLYLAGNGDCVSFGRGGFGRFANLLSYNATCALKHIKQFYPDPCEGYPPLDKTQQQLAAEGFRF